MHEALASLRKTWLAAALLGATLVLAAWFAPPPTLTSPLPQGLPRGFAAAALLLTVAGWLLPRRALGASLSSQGPWRRPSTPRGLDRFRRRRPPGQPSSLSRKPSDAAFLSACRGALTLGLAAAEGVLLLGFTLARLGAARVSYVPLLTLGGALLLSHFPTAQRLEGARR